VPTEAEWEYACRGAATDKAACSYDYYFDRPTNDLDSTQANFDGSHPGGSGAKGSALGRPRMVGSYKPNTLGLYDMHGNVRQWCVAESGDEGSDAVSPAIRGGSWHGTAENCRAAFRSDAAPTGRADDRGFRLVRVRAESEPKGSGTGSP
jgi:formylglycine-generating enzyme required for sulfatase activity